MDAQRTKKLGDGRKVEEIYWAGRLVVYIDNSHTEMKFDDINDQTAPKSIHRCTRCNDKAGSNRLIPWRDDTKICKVCKRELGY